MSKNKERVFGMFFVVTKNGVEKIVANPQKAKDAQNKLLKEIEGKNEEKKLEIPKEIKRELMKNFQKFLDEA